MLFSDVSTRCRLRDNCRRQHDYSRGLLFDDSPTLDCSVADALTRRLLDSKRPSANGTVCKSGCIKLRPHDTQNCLTQYGLMPNEARGNYLPEAHLLTRDKDLSQPATRVDTTCWQLFRPDINTAHFYFLLLQKLYQIT